LSRRGPTLCPLLPKNGTIEPVSMHTNQVSADGIRILKICDWRLPVKFAKYGRR
jgi:hypothetical protein